VTHEVVVTATARRDLESITPRLVPAIVEFIFGDLAANPRRVGKALQRELTDLFGARRGPYRILHSIDDAAQRVVIFPIDHRSDVYRGD
jgi:mRNA-degrading endonuclease RelE of RelBE toxin-antitoxin system